MFGKTFTSDSWIYIFLAWPDKFLSGAPRTICELRSAFILKCILIFLGVTALMGYTASLTYFLLAVITSWFPSFLGGIYVYNDFANAGRVVALITALALFVITFVATCIFFANKINDAQVAKRMEAHRTGIPIQPNSMVLMFTSWKDKICYPVTFKHPPEPGYDNDDYPHNGQTYVEVM